MDNIVKHCEKPGNRPKAEEKHRKRTALRNRH